MYVSHILQLSSMDISGIFNFLINDKNIILIEVNSYIH